MQQKYTAIDLGGYVIFLGVMAPVLMQTAKTGRSVPRLERTVQKYTMGSDTALAYLCQDLPYDDHDLE